MAGIQAQQGATTVNAAGTASFSQPQTGIVVGTLVTLSLVGTTHAGYAWSLSAPVGSASVLSGAASATPSFIPDAGGDGWLVTLLGLSSGAETEATYILPLSVPQTALAEYPGPLSLAYLPPTSVATPGIGQVLYQNWSKGGALSLKDASAVTRQVAILRSGTTGSRPATTNLDIGTQYFDTSLGHVVTWSGSTWVNHTGATV